MRACRSDASRQQVARALLHAEQHSLVATFTFNQHHASAAPCSLGHAFFLGVAVAMRGRGLVRC